MVCVPVSQYNVKLSLRFFVLLAILSLCGLSLSAPLYAQSMEQEGVLVLVDESAKQSAPGTASIRSFVWEDTDLDGIQLSNFGETPLPSVTVTLYHSNGLIAGIRTTNSDGYCEFTNLSAGSYYLSFGFLRGLVPTHQHSGDDSAVDSDIDQITGLTAPFTLEDGEELESLDAGFTHTGSIQSVVWSDLDLNGVRDSGEPGVPATVVTLYDENDLIIQSVPTDMHGNFEFPLVTPGMYTLGFSPPPGMSFTQQGVQSSALNSEVDPSTGLTASVQVTAGPNNFDWGAGLVVLVPTALETISEPILSIELNERFTMKLFVPFIGGLDIAR